MIQKIEISFIGKPDREHIALLLEVIAREIRQGCLSGQASEYFWTGS